MLRTECIRECWLIGIRFICGSGEATEEIVIVSGSIAPDNCVELSIIGVLCLMGLFSGKDCST